MGGLGSGRPRTRSAVSRIADGSFRPSRHGKHLLAELGVETLEEAYAIVRAMPSTEAELRVGPFRVRIIYDPQVTHAA